LKLKCFLFHYNTFNTTFFGLYGPSSFGTQHQCPRNAQHLPELRY
jgi:hypothetical protein